MKRLLSTLLALTMALTLVSCGKSNPTPNTGSNKTETPSETTDTKTEGNVHIGIVTGSVSQSEDDRRGAEAFQALYGEDMVKLAIYPDNFTEELETTIQTIVNLADDADMKAIIVNQSVPGTTEAFRKIKEIRPDILCIAGEAHEDLNEIGSAADLVCNNDFVARGYLIIRTAHELGCDTFVHISFPRHLAYETMSRRIAVMKAACEEFGMKFEMETAPDPTSDVGVAGAQAYILEKVPEWSKTYGEKAAYFCTNDAHTEPLLKQLLQYGGYFIEADLPSPLMGYPGALGLDLTEEAGDFDKILKKVGEECAATIIAAEKIAKTKKLLKLTIDTGIDKRTIVSGIAEHYTPEELVGRQVLVLVNLEPRTLKGIESRGMILMGEDAVGKLVLLEPAAPVNSGAVVG